MDLNDPIKQRNENESFHDQPKLSQLPSRVPIPITPSKGSNNDKNNLFRINNDDHSNGEIGINNTSPTIELFEGLSTSTTPKSESFIDSPPITKRSPIPEFQGSPTQSYLHKKIKEEASEEETNKTMTTTTTPTTPTTTNCSPTTTSNLTNAVTRPLTSKKKKGSRTKKSRSFKKRLSLQVGTGGFEEDSPFIPFPSEEEATSFLLSNPDAVISVKIQGRPPARWSLLDFVLYLQFGRLPSYNCNTQQGNHLYANHKIAVPSWIETLISGKSTTISTSNNRSSKPLPPLPSRSSNRRTTAASMSATPLTLITPEVNEQIKQDPNENENENGVPKAEIESLERRMRFVHGDDFGVVNHSTSDRSSGEVDASSTTNTTMTASSPSKAPPPLPPHPSKGSSSPEPSPSQGANSSIRPRPASYHSPKHYQRLRQTPMAAIHFPASHSHLVAATSGSSPSATAPGSRLSLPVSLSASLTASLSAPSLSSHLGHHSHSRHAHPAMNMTDTSMPLEFNIGVVSATPGVGKSSLINQFVNHTFLSEYHPTLEEVYRTSVEVNEKVFILNIHDTGGQAAFQDITKEHLTGKDGYLVVFALNDPASFEGVKDVVPALTEAYNTRPASRTLSFNSNESYVSSDDKSPQAKPKRRGSFRKFFSGRSKSPSKPTNNTNNNSNKNENNTHTQSTSPIMTSDSTLEDLADSSTSNKRSSSNSLDLMSDYGIIPPIILVGNKQDFATHKVTTTSAQALKRSLLLDGYVSTSSQDFASTQVAFQLLAQTIFLSKQREERLHSNSSTSTKKTKQKKR